MKPWCTPRGPYLPVVLVAAVTLGMLVPRTAAAQEHTFSAGSIVIPMDTDYQDSGMLKAFGLLYALLKGGVPVHWVIKSPKNLGDSDFITICSDYKTTSTLPLHGYRGGPFVIDADQAINARPIINAWQTANPTVTVHVATQEFTARSGRYLTAAPTIAIIADGNEKIAFAYLNAAGIPDRLGNAWTASSPDLLSIAGIEGPTNTNHCDGALFRSSGQPNYCQIMTMHWGTKEVWGVHDEAVAEYRCFLGFPVHMFAECQAVNAVENDVYGKFITTTGFVIDNNVKATGPFEFLNMNTPFAQMDGTYNLVGGSEIAYSLPAGGAYYDQNVVMIKDMSTPLGQRSIWMTGYLGGVCSVFEGGGACSAGVGKVSMLGGHQYSVTLPISTHPTTQGTRLFLNSLFEAGCVTSEGQPIIELTKYGPTSTTSSTVTYHLGWANVGPGPAIGLALSDTIPAGATYVSSTGGGVRSGSTVTWNLGDVGSQSSGLVELTVSLSSYGSYTNSFNGTYTVGVNSKTVTSNSVVTNYQATPPPPEAGSVIDSGVSLDRGGRSDIDGNGDRAGYRDQSSVMDFGHVVDAWTCLPTGHSCVKSSSCCSTLCLGTCVEQPPLPDAGPPTDASAGGDDASSTVDAAQTSDSSTTLVDFLAGGDRKSNLDGRSTDGKSSAADGTKLVDRATGNGDGQNGWVDTGGAAGGDGKTGGGEGGGGPSGGAAAGGCGCQTGAASGAPPTLLLIGLMAALPLLLARRRRR